MRVILFTESDDLYRKLNDICLSKDAYIELIRVSYDKVKTLTLTSIKDIYIIDDDYYEKIGSVYLEFLKSLKVDLITIVSDLSALEKYMEFNVVEYMYGKVDSLRLRLCLDRLYKRNTLITKTRSSKLNDKMLIRSKNEVAVVSVADISYIKLYADYVQVMVDNTTYISTDTLNYFESMTSDSFFRVSDDYIVNFEKVIAINKVNYDDYELSLHGCQKKIVIGSDYASYAGDDEVENMRRNYLIDTIKDHIS